MSSNENPAQTNISQDRDDTPGSAPEHEGAPAPEASHDVAEAVALDVEFDDDAWPDADDEAWPETDVP